MLKKSKFFNWLGTEIKRDFVVEDKGFYKIMSVGVILSLLTLVSFWWAPMVYIVLTLACIALIFIKSIRKVYLLIFLLPFYNVLRYNPSDLVLSSYLLAFTIFLLGIRFLIQLLKKEKTIDLKVTILFFCLIVYMWLPISSFNIMNSLRLTCTFSMLYLCYVNRKELDFKSLVFSLLFGTIIASFFSLFRCCSVRLDLFLPKFENYVYEGGVRFSGLISDPNCFAVEVILLIATITQLYFTKKIGRLVYFPIIVLLSILGFLTVSKAFFVSLVCFLLLCFIYILMSNKNGKKKWLKMICFFCFLAFLFLIGIRYYIAIIKRFDSSYIDILGDDSQSKLNSITTGRLDIWIAYLKDIFSSLKNIFFGHGIGAEALFIKDGFVAVHNFYIEILYCCGIIGTLLMIALALILYLRDPRKLKRPFVNFIPLATLAIMQFSLNGLVQYRPYIIIIILAYSLNQPTMQADLKNDSLAIKQSEKREEDILYSIIVPIYKVENYLKQCVESLINQTYKNLEIILVDDGSPDRCPAICNDFAKSDNRIKVIHKKNGGLVSARKAGAEVSTGEYVFCVDGDDFVARDMVEKVHNVIKNCEVDVIAFGFYKDIEENENKIQFEYGYYDKERIKAQIFPYLVEHKSAKYFPNAIVWKAYKRDIYVKEQLSIDNSIKIGEDLVCTKALISKVNSMYIMEDCFYFYRTNCSSMTKEKKPFAWNVPKLIYNHLEESLDKNYDFSDQLYRNVAHNVFNVAVSQFYNKELSQEEIKKQIVDNIENDEVYSKCIKNAKYSSLKGKLMLFALRHKSFFLMKLYSKLK